MPYTRVGKTVTHTARVLKWPWIIYSSSLAGLGNNGLVVKLGSELKSYFSCVRGALSWNLLPVIIIIIIVVVLVLVALVVLVLVFQISLSLYSSTSVVFNRLAFKWKKKKRKKFVIVFFNPLYFFCWVVVLVSSSCSFSSSSSYLLNSFFFLFSLAILPV